MPDLVTHTGVVYLAGRWNRLWELRAVFLLGAVLPDVVTRPISILWPKFFWHVHVWHTPVGIVLVAAWASLWFETRERRAVFGVTLAGSAVHLALDALQRHVLFGYFWFFPFSSWTYEGGLIWPEASLDLLPLWLVGIPLIEIAVRRRDRREPRRASSAFEPRLGRGPRSRGGRQK